MTHRLTFRNLTFWPCFKPSRLLFHAIGMKLSPCGLLLLRTKKKARFAIVTIDFAECCLFWFVNRSLCYFCEELVRVSPASYHLGFSLSALDADRFVFGPTSLKTHRSPYVFGGRVDLYLGRFAPTSLKTHHS